MSQDQSIPVAVAVAVPDHPVVQQTLSLGPVGVQGATDYLTRHGWPNGMQQAILKEMSRIPYRFFICDDSSSMVTNDGHKIVGEGARRQSVPASRWSELGDFVRFHSGLCEAARVAAQFRMLNGSAPLVVGTGTDNGVNISILHALLDDSPAGKTPLCENIRAVIEEIRGMEQTLRDNRQRVAVIIATDGESSDGDMAVAMAPLKDLPVWVVVRLCTDEASVVDYWNNIDKVLELDLDILDDLSGEAREVCTSNPWLTYGEPLHRMREFGVTLKEIDLLDESSLSSEQAMLVIRTILGGEAHDYPSPYTEWNRFVQYIDRLQQGPTTSRVWDPLTSDPNARWIKINQLGPLFGHASSSCVIM